MMDRRLQAKPQMEQGEESEWIREAENRPPERLRRDLTRGRRNDSTCPGSLGKEGTASARLTKV